ncbi:nucleotidyltransferase domain-containing protein [Sneathiella aquimaris]|uniref:nucleotidyltransferase domain-containing protein n=1 Tax=Sneathiella aquimaris TaxID=2599305 RepID=UPI003899A268
MIDDCQSLRQNLNWYVFGSVIRNIESPSDIDILCVVKDQKTMRLVKERCEKHLLCAPIHLRLLTEKDEEALHFLEKTPVQRIL